MDDKLEVKSQLRVQDVLRFNLYVAYNTKINMVFSVISIISLGVFVFNIINSAQPVFDAFTRNFGLLIAPIIFFVVIPAKVLIVTRNLIGSKVLDQEVKYVFTEECVTLETDEGSEDVPWSAYVKIKETRNDFRFFIDKVQAQLIPKYNLDEKQIKKLREIIKNSAKQE